MDVDVLLFWLRLGSLLAIAVGLVLGLRRPRLSMHVTVGGLVAGACGALGSGMADDDNMQLGFAGVFVLLAVLRLATQVQFERAADERQPDR